MKKIILICAALFCLTNVTLADSDKALIQTHAPTAQQKKITNILIEKLTQIHYRKVSLNDELSTIVFDEYINGLDPSHSYFKASDMEQFEGFKTRIDDTLKKADLSPAFTIFNVYLDRVINRIDFALALVEKNDFDFTIDENYLRERKDAPWADSDEQWNDLWRKRVKNDYLSLKLNDRDEADIKTDLINRYSNVKRRTLQLNSDDIFQIYINSYTAAIEPHTSYFSPRTSENFKIRMSLSLEGIGAVLESDDEYTTIRSIVPGGPAGKDGQLKSGDKIIGVGQGKDSEITNVIGWRLDDVVDKIRGAKGTVVQLEVLSNNANGISKKFHITRDEIKLEEQAAKKDVLTIEKDGRSHQFGVINIPTFYSDFEGRSRGDKDFRSTSRDVRKLIAELKEEDIEGIVIDLRNNSGGSLIEADELTGLFIHDGPVVQILDSMGKLNINLDPDPEIVYDGPLIVMINRNSASASEIFAGAIQDYKRGLLVGEPTYGKGTVQNLISLNQFQWVKDTDLGQAKLTFAQFFRVNGDSTQYRGVVPDIRFPTALGEVDYGERSLKHALPWSKVEPTRHATYQSSIDAQSIKFLTDKHQLRMQDNPGVDYLIEEYNLIDEYEKTPTVSLLESKRKQRVDLSIRKRLDKLNAFRLSIDKPELTKEEFISDDFNEDEDNLDGESDDKSLVNKEDVLLFETGEILTDYINMFVAPISPIVDSNNNSVVN